jgi:hypothetical protein
VTPGTDSRWPPAHARHRHAGRAGSPARTLMASHLVEVVTVPGLGTGSCRAVEVVTLQGSRAARGQGGDAGHRHAGRAGSPARTLRASHLVEVVTVPGLGTGSRRAVEVVTLATGRPGGRGGHAGHRLTLATGSRRAPAGRAGRFTSSNAHGFAHGRGGDGAGPWHWITPCGQGGDAPRIEGSTWSRG